MLGTAPGAAQSAWLHSMFGVAQGALAGVGDVGRGAGGVHEVGLGGRGGGGVQAGFAAGVYPKLPTPHSSPLLSLQVLEGP